MLSTAEDIISSRTIAAGDGREVAAVAAAAAAAATNIPLHSHSHTLQLVIGQLTVLLRSQVDLLRVPVLYLLKTRERERGNEVMNSAIAHKLHAMSGGNH